MDGRPSLHPWVAQRRERVTLRHVARLADVANFGPGPAIGVETPDDARCKHTVLRRHCDEVGRPYDDVLRSHVTHWVILAETEDDLAAKVKHSFPRGLDAFWGAYLVAKTPAGAIDYFQSYAESAPNTSAPKSSTPATQRHSDCSRRRSRHRSCRDELLKDVCSTIRTKIKAIQPGFT